MIYLPKDEHINEYVVHCECYGEAQLLFESLIDDGWVWCNHEHLRLDETQCPSDSGIYYFLDWRVKRVSYAEDDSRYIEEYGLSEDQTEISLRDVLHGASEESSEEEMSEESENFLREFSLLLGI